MTRQKGLLMGAVTLGVALAAIPVRASDPIGIYCVVQKVVLAPDEQHPTTAQVWGACAEATGGGAEDRSYTPGWYAAPRTGYLYYTAPRGQEAVAAREWLDLKRVAGTGEVVGFGSRRQNTGRMRVASEVPRDPDPYPVHNGITRLNAAQQVPDPAHADLVKALRKAAGVK